MAEKQPGTNIGKDAASAASNASGISNIANLNRKSKDAGKTASQNPAVRALIIKLIAIGLILSLVLTPILFLFALPTMMYEAVMSFVENLKEDFATYHWEREQGINFVTALKNAVENVWMDTIGNLWTRFKNWLTNEDDRNYSDIDKENLGDDPDALRVTQVEAAQKATLMSCVTATEEAYKTRTDEMKEEITAPGSYIYSLVQSYGSSSYASQYGGFPQWNDYVGTHQTQDTAYESLEEATADAQQTYYVYGGATISVTASKMKDTDAAKIMAINTVSRGASLKDMKLSDYQKWLGYNPDVIDLLKWWPWRARKYEVPLDIGLGSDNPWVDRWIGTCLPQYLQDQERYEISKFGSVVSAGMTSQSCAAIDLCIQVQASDITQMSGMTSNQTVTETRMYKTWETPGAEEDGGTMGQPVPLRVTIDGGGGGSSSSSSTTPPPAQQSQSAPPAVTATPAPVLVYNSVDLTFNVVYVTYTFSVSIKPRDPETILDLIGFVGTEYASETQAAGGHTSLTSQHAVGGDLPPTS